MKWKDPIEFLQYSSYAHNRQRSPHIEPQRWKLIFPNQETYEIIYSNTQQVEEHHD